MAQATISSVAACSVAYMLDILELSISSTILDFGDNLRLQNSQDK
ncbi:hypothetical protein ACSDIA_004062 [Cronobacter turicensis]|nr:MULTISPECIES: hypothetical protein [Cronobacter]MDI7398974.1 hypothetical protein [Cronobacter dublinensis]MDK1175993.1 hypothetical protein [Cronobacter malonaticus]MDK1688077.1 hypothetical protein [Cronobacter malonaticus]